MVWPDAQQNSGCDPLRQRDEPGIELTAQNSPKPHGGKVGMELDDSCYGNSFFGGVTSGQINFPSLLI